MEQNEKDKLEAPSGAPEGASNGTADAAPEEAPEGATPLVRAMLAGVIRGYQMFISPLFPPSCRFHPTCSEYTRQAIIRHGAFKGIWLGIVRISKCHPFHPGGFDPVP